jgi:putative nucleotidyltransferase with HDIG domain
MSTGQDAAFAFVKELGDELTRGEFDLPPFPDIAIRVRDALNNPDVGSNDVARIVLAEPALTARLLRMANSALLRRGSTEITDVKAAINRLGFEMVRNAAVSLAMDKSFGAPKGSVLRSHVDKTRKHCIDVCALAYVLAKRQSSIAADEAMLVGLLHDIGKFYILSRIEAFPDLFSEEQTLHELLQQWHTGVGRAIVEAWEFPEQIAEAVDEHELLDREHFGPADLTDIVSVANLLAHMDEPQYAERVDPSQIPACQRLNVDTDTIQELLQESEAEVRSMAQALKR